MCLCCPAAVCVNTGLHPDAVNVAIPTDISAVVVEATPTPVPMPNYTERGSKRGCPMGSTAEVTALKTGPNGKTAATENATSNSGNITSMFLVVLRYLSGGMKHTAAADVVRTVRAVAYGINSGSTRATTGTPQLIPTSSRLEAAAKPAAAAWWRRRYQQDVNE
ncbi:unnamed protein product, partial [Ectocarpus sp. 4 AP-2014]